METDKDDKSVVEENELTSAEIMEEDEPMPVETENEPQSQVQLNSDEEAVKLLNAQNAAQNFLNSINPEVLDLCLFDEQLVTVSPEGNSVGEFKASVEKTEVGGEVLLLVHASSNGKIEGTPMRSSLTAYLKPADLSVVKQEHHEFVKVPGHELDKRTEIELSKETGHLAVNRKIIHGDKIKKMSFKVPKERLSCFITEGSSIVMERLMIRSGDESEFMSFTTLDSEVARFVPTMYSWLPSRKQQIGIREVEVYGIERKLQSIGDIPQTWQSYFLDDAHLTMRIQIGSPVIAMLEKVPRKIEPEVFEPKPVFSKQLLDWEEDMEMKSKFLGRKEELKASHQTYLREHPEVKALLADFFQFLLLRKPENVVSFASEFFSSFSNSLPDVSPYSHSNASSYKENIQPAENGPIVSIAPTSTDP